MPQWSIFVLDFQVLKDIYRLYSLVFTYCWWELEDQLHAELSLLFHNTLYVNYQSFFGILVNAVKLYFFAE